MRREQVREMIVSLQGHIAGPGQSNQTGGSHGTGGEQTEPGAERHSHSAPGMAPVCTDDRAHDRTAG